MHVAAYERVDTVKVWLSCNTSSFLCPSGKCCGRLAETSAPLHPTTYLSLLIKCLTRVQVGVQVGCRGCKWGASDGVGKHTAPCKPPFKSTGSGLGCKGAARKIAYPFLLSLAIIPFTLLINCKNYILFSILSRVLIWNILICAAILHPMLSAGTGSGRLESAATKAKTEGRTGDKIGTSSFNSLFLIYSLANQQLSQGGTPPKCDAGFPQSSCPVVARVFLSFMALPQKALRCLGVLSGFMVLPQRASLFLGMSSRFRWGASQILVLSANNLFFLKNGGRGGAHICLSVWQVVP